MMAGTVPTVIIDQTKSRPGSWDGGLLYSSDESDDELHLANELGTVGDRRTPAASPAPGSGSASPLSLGSASPIKDLDLQDTLELSISGRDYAALVGRKVTSLPADCTSFRKSLKLGEILGSCASEEEAAEAKRMFRLRKATKELLESEQAYLEDLKRIEFVYTQLNDELLDEQEAAVIFKNIDWLVETHSTLISSLDKIVPELIVPYDKADLDFAISQVSAIFCNVDFLPVYGPYCANHPAQLATLSNANSNSELQAILKSWQQTLPVALPLEAYLLKPIQRVLKYKLLFGEMLKSALKSDTCYDQVSFACDAFQVIAKRTNQVKRMRELKSVHLGEVKVVRGLSLAEKLAAGGWDGDLQEWGALYEEAKGVTIISRNGLVPKRRSKPKLRTLYLFERGIFSCKVYAENKQSVKEIFPLAEVEASVHNSKVLILTSASDSFMIEGIASRSWHETIVTLYSRSGDGDGDSDTKSKIFTRKKFQVLRSKRRIAGTSNSSPVPDSFSPGILIVRPNAMPLSPPSTHSSPEGIVLRHPKPSRIDRQRRSPISMQAVDQSPMRPISSGKRSISPSPSYTEQLNRALTECDTLRCQNNELILEQGRLTKELMEIRSVQQVKSVAKASQCEIKVATSVKSEVLSLSSHSAQTDFLTATSATSAAVQTDLQSSTNGDTPREGSELQSYPMPDLEDGKLEAKTIMQVSSAEGTGRLTAPSDLSSTENCKNDSTSRNLTRAFIARHSIIDPERERKVLPWAILTGAVALCAGIILGWKR